jgi:hypothetical protein
VTKAEAGAYFERMDADKSGFITLDEWIGFYANFMQFDVDEKELLDSFIGLWQQPTALFPETCQRHEEEEYIPKEKLFEVWCAVLHLFIFENSCLVQFSDVTCICSLHDHPLLAAHIFFCLPISVCWTKNIPTDLRS